MSMIDHGHAVLEHTGRDPESLSFELMFDGLETSASAMPDVEALERNARPIPDGTRRAMPPHVRVVWIPRATVSVTLEQFGQCSE